MKEIYFTFDAFGQWSEHDRSKMKWRLKVGIEWRPSMAGPIKDWWSVDHPPSLSFPPFPSTISLFSSTTIPLGQSRDAMAT
jgi:hypothetical protein